MGEAKSKDFSDQDYHDEVVKCRNWFDVDKDHKSPITQDLQEYHKLWVGDHWDLLGPTGEPIRNEKGKRIRPNHIEPMTFALTEGLVSEFSEDIDIIDYGTEAGDDESASLMTDLKKFVFYKNKFPTERNKWLRSFFGYGTGIWHPHWDPSWRGGKGPNKWEGEIRVISQHVGSIFPDARCLSNIEEGRRIHKAVYRTQEYIKEKFGKDVEDDLLDEALLIGDIPGDVNLGEMGEGRSLLVETWYKGDPLILEGKEKNLGSGLHVIWWAGEYGVYLGHDNYVYFEPDEDPMFPFIFKCRYPRENSVWGYSEGHFLKQPQIILNKTGELIIQGHMMSALGQTLFQETAFTPRQRKFIEEYGSMPEVWIPCKDPQAINRIQGKGVPESLMGETTRLHRLMETTVGRFDVSQGRTPGSVTAFRALDLLAARAQVRLRSAESEIIAGYEELGTFMNHLIVTCYTEKRAYRVLGEHRRDDDQGPGKEEMQPKYGTYDPKSLKKVYFAGPPSTVMSMEDFEEWGGEERAEQAGLEYEIYCPQYDSFCKISTTMPSDRMFFLEIAKELFAAQLIDAEIFWYVVDRGKFPPFEDLLEKVKEQKAMQEQMLQQQQQQEQQMMDDQMAEQSSEISEEAASAHLEALFNSDPELAAQFENLSPEEQQKVVNISRQQQAGGGPQ